jgi:hypothetical protein
MGVVGAKEPSQMRLLFLILFSQIWLVFLISSSTSTRALIASNLCGVIQGEEERQSFH